MWSLIVNNIYEQLSMGNLSNTFLKSTFAATDFPHTPLLYIYINPKRVSFDASDRWVCSHSSLKRAGSYTNDPPQRCGSSAVLVVTPIGWHIASSLEQEFANTVAVKYFRTFETMWYCNSREWSSVTKDTLPESLQTIHVSKVRCSTL